MLSKLYLTNAIKDIHVLDMDDNGLKLGVFLYDICKPHITIDNNTKMVSYKFKDEEGNVSDMNEDINVFITELFRIADDYINLMDPDELKERKRIDTAYDTISGIKDTLTGKSKSIRAVLVYRNVLKSFISHL